MAALVVLALIALVLFGVGFTIHVLWWVAVVAAVVWLVSLFAHPRYGMRGRRSGYSARSGRW